MHPRPSSLAVALAAVLAACKSSSTPRATPVELRVTRVDPRTGIGDTRFPNGLRLITLERRDLPIVTTILAYRVGSASESKGTTGLSHFLEHMMFKGTDRYKKGEIDLLTQRNGGQNNAFTTPDYTAYWFAFPADRLDVALEIEADRMRNCVFDEKEFEAERGAILSELRGGLDLPGGLLEQEVEAAMFTQHPYHHPVIGWEEDVEHVTRAELSAFYDRFYCPANATLCVVGDFDVPTLVARVNRLFGSIPVGREASEIWSKEPPLAGVKRIVVKEEIEVPRLLIRYRTRPFNDADQAALDVVEEILGGGRSSRLYRRLVDRDASVTAISAASDARRLDGLFSIDADLTLGASLDGVERAIRAEVADLGAQPVPPQELSKAKSSIRADFVFTSESRVDEATRLVDWAMLGSLDELAGYLESIDRVTEADVQRVASLYLPKDRFVVGCSIPKDSDDANAKDSPPGSGEAPSGSSLDQPRRAASTPRSRPRRFGRSPSAVTLGRAGRGIDALPVSRSTLANGLVMLLLPRPGIPSIAFDLDVDAGHRFDPPGKEGLSMLVGRLLEEGTRTRTGFEIASAIDSVGGTLEAGNDGVAVHVLSRDAALGLDLLGDVAMQPRFSPDDVERVRARLLSEIAADRDEPEVIGLQAFRGLVYGKHPYAIPEKGTEETVRSLDRADVVAFHERFFVPNHSILAVTGDFEPVEMRRRVEEALGGWQRRSEPLPEIPGPSPQAGTVEKRVPADRRQSHVFLGHLGVRRADPDFLPLLVLDNILGTAAGFTARLPRRLRDEDGLAYTVYSNVTATSGVEPGVFTAYIGTRPELVLRAVAEMREEIARIREQLVPPEELDSVKHYLLGSFVYRLETRPALAMLLVAIERFSLGFDYPKTFRERISAITAEDIRRVARLHLRPDRMTLVIVGEAGERPSDETPAEPKLPR